MTKRPRLIALTTLVVGLVAGCAVWGSATGTPLRSPYVLIIPLGILLVGGVVMEWISPRIDSPFARMLVGLFVGVAVAEAAAVALVRPSPGSIAVIVYGTIGLAVGTALGLAAVAMGSSKEIRT